MNQVYPKPSGQRSRYSLQSKAKVTPSRRSSRWTAGQSGTRRVRTAGAGAAHPYRRFVVVKLGRQEPGQAGLERPEDVPADGGAGQACRDAYGVGLRPSA
ncbi:MAG: hypothetical protein P4L84_09690, partial [Isosphaeraceae bacterium]|nr:hypothetical protein [Isosphaeraceae bacterium]